MQNYNVAIGFVLAVLILALGHFVFHIPEGLGRLALFGGAALVFCLCAFAWKPRA
jgi:hypothetical protein